MHATLVGRVDRLEARVDGYELRMNTTQSLFTGLDTRIAAMHKDVTTVVDDLRERNSRAEHTEKLLRRVALLLQIFGGVAVVLGIMWGVFHFAVRHVDTRPVVTCIGEVQ